MFFFSAGWPAGRTTGHTLVGLFVVVGFWWEDARVCYQNFSLGSSNRSCKKRKYATRIDSMCCHGWRVVVASLSGAAAVH